MNAATVAELLSDLIDAPAMVKPAPTAVNPAKAAKTGRQSGLVVDSGGCESLRKSANGVQDSQVFAGVRKPDNRPQSEQRCGDLQDSQDSQGGPACSTKAPAIDLAAVARTDADIAAFLERRGRLLRWGWPEKDATALAERLARRDAEDDRRACVECSHYRPGRCGNHRAAGLHTHDLGRDLASLPQRCAGFLSASDRPIE